MHARKSRPTHRWSSPSLSLHNQLHPSTLLFALTVLGANSGIMSQRIVANKLGSDNKEIFSLIHSYSGTYYTIFCGLRIKPPKLFTNVCSSKFKVISPTKS